MLVIWICLMSGIDFKSADVCARRIAQGEAFEAPFRQLVPYVLVHMVTSLELDHSFIHRYGLARLPVALTLFTNNVIQIANFAQAITFISYTRLRALKKLRMARNCSLLRICLAHNPCNKLVTLQYSPASLTITNPKCSRRVRNCDIWAASTSNLEPSEWAYEVNSRMCIHA